MSLKYNARTRILFIGDSITDCGRRDDPEALGWGYVRLVRDYVLAKDPVHAPIIINRGIGGNNIRDLKARWEADVLAEAPDVLSIKIGINDVWQRLKGGGPGVPIDQYAAIYQDLLSQVRKHLPRCKLILCEPSVIWPPAPEEGNEELQPYIQAVHEMEGAFGAECVVQLHEALEWVKRARPEIPWAPDGVHPGGSGHMVIARTWLTATGTI